MTLLNGRNVEHTYGPRVLTFCRSSFSLLFTYGPKLCNFDAQLFSLQLGRRSLWTYSRPERLLSSVV